MNENENGEKLGQPRCHDEGTHAVNPFDNNCRECECECLDRLCVTPAPHTDPLVP